MRAKSHEISVEGPTYPESELFCEIEACIGPVERLEEVPTDRVYHKISVVETAHNDGQQCEAEPGYLHDSSGLIRQSSTTLLVHSENQVDIYGWYMVMVWMHARNGIHH